MTSMDVQKPTYHGENGPTRRNTDNPVTLRLIAYGGERPILAFGTVTPGSKKDAFLHLLNEADLDCILTLETLPAGISLVDENGDFPSVKALTIPRRSSRVLQVSWRPDGTTALNDALRWKMAEGGRQALLEVRLQGTVASEAPASARGSRTAGRIMAKVIDTRGSRSTTATSTNLKPPPKTLSLARPTLVAAGPSPAQAQFPQDERRSGTVEPLGPIAPAPSSMNLKLSTMTSIASPQPVLSSRSQTAWQAAGTPPRGCNAAESSKLLDFRRVGYLESKRERALISWMNSEVAPLGTATSDSSGSGVEGHVVRRLLGEVTGKAYVHFKRDESFAVMASKIELKIAAKQLTIRDAEHTLSDVRMRQQALDVLTSYHPFWLAVGLQTVLGRALVFSHGNMLALMRPNGEVPPFIRIHILEHFLADQDLAVQFRQVAFKTEYWETLGAKVLGRVLLLVLLLDRTAQRQDLPGGTPSLFRQDAKIKSSEQVVQEFLQPRLAGAGDVRHSLRMMAYSTAYVQHARDEADFRVCRPLDLRDGTRLAKLLDNLRRQDPVGTDGSIKPVLNGQSPLKSALPCTSRVLAPGADLLPSMAFPQNTGKPMDESLMRNNCLRFVRALQQQGIGLQGLVSGPPACFRDPGLDGTAKLVAEGLLRVDQKITLGVLWQLAMHFKLRRHVNVRSLEREAARLRRAANLAVASDETVPSQYSGDPTSQALLLWMRAACAPYGVTVDDFCWSLSDGRALCYLVHAYMPEVLPKSGIISVDLPSSTDDMARLTGGAEYVNLETLKAKGWAAVYELGGAIHDDILAVAYKRSVEANFKVAHAAGEALGVPAMLSAEDYLNDGPDELAAILYVTLLAEALLRLTSERRAAYMIMEFLRRRLSWRPKFMRASLVRFKADMFRSEAALTIQAFWRMRCQRCRYLRLWRAACVIQAFGRRWLLQQCLRRRLHAARLLQAWWRGHAVRSRLNEERRAAVKIQAAWRGFTTRLAYVRLLNATLIIQHHVRRCNLHNRRLHDRQAAVKVQAAIKVQAAWRGYVVRERVQELRAAAVAIQAFERMRQAYARYHIQRQAVFTIQAAWRMHQARQWFERRRQAAICIQASWRRCMAQRGFMEIRLRMVCIQAHIRGYLARREVSACLEGVIRIQAAWRAVQARRIGAAKMYEKSVQNHAAAVLQAVVRGHLVRQQITNYCRAAMVIQAHWRMVSIHRWYDALRLAAVTIQATTRSWLVQRRLQEQQHGAIVIQAFWRRWSAMSLLRTSREAAITIQSAWRAWQQRCYFLAVRQAAVQVQRAWRLQRQIRAATVLQAYWRMLLARRFLIRSKKATILIQSRYRCIMAMRRMENMRAAAQVIQRSWRCAVARKKLAQRVEAYYMDRLRREEERLLEIARHYMLSTAAAKRIQAWWRGHLVRKAFIPIWKRHKELTCQQRAAIVIQSAWRAYKARTSYRRVRQAVGVITSTLVPIFRARRELALLRRRYHVRTKAAIAIQKFVRMWLARSMFLKVAAAAVKIQAAWRGHVVRVRDGTPDLLDARCRLEQAANEARKDPSRRIGYRTREALEVLQRPNKNLSQVLTALDVIEISTRYSRDCCKLFTQYDGVSALLRFVKSCNRSKPYSDVLNRTLAVLHNICRYNTLLPEVYYAEESLTVLSELAQYFRDTEEVFIPTVTLLQRLTAAEDLAANVPAAVLRHWEGIHQVLFRKADTERKYLERLEGQKGSDVSARESARKLVVLQQQMLALEVLIGRACETFKVVGVSALDVANDQDKDEPMRRLGTGKAGAGVVAVSTQATLPMPGFKNTVVKNVVQRMASTTAAFSTLRTGGHNGLVTTSSPKQLSKGVHTRRRMDVQ